jgi:tryptophanyl-tRNA synthetase
MTENEIPLLATHPVRGKRLLSGIQPSGQLHLGNYFGAMQQHIAGQEANECFFFIANFHAMTSVRDAAALARLSRDVALDYLALGLDPERVALYRQSDLPEVTELAWMLSCGVGMGDLEKAVSYKDKVARGLPASVGLFFYPVLMAADILIVRSDVVPVGQDQIQHLEMARRYAGRFHEDTGRSDVFRIPQAQLNEARIVPGIDGQKMSKSYGNTIPLFTEPKAARKLIMSIKTDSTPVESPKDPEKCTVFQLLKLIAPPAELAGWDDRYRRGGMGYGEAKGRLAELYEARFGPARERRRELEAHPDRLEEILVEGARKARRIAHEVMDAARDAAGILRARRA